MHLELVQVCALGVSLFVSYSEFEFNEQLLMVFVCLCGGRLFLDAEGHFGVHGPQGSARQPLHAGSCATAPDAGAAGENGR